MKYKNMKKITVIAVSIMICILTAFPVMAQTKTCKVSKCSNQAVEGSDYCSLHKCGVSGCTKKATKKGYCSSHQTKSSREKDSKSAKTSGTCAVNNCSRTKAYKSNYCSKHTCKKSNCYNQKSASAQYCSEHLKKAMPDCDDYEDYDDFMDDWDGCMPDGSDAEDYWENW